MTLPDVMAAPRGVLPSGAGTMQDGIDASAWSELDASRMPDSLGSHQADLQLEAYKAFRLNQKSLGRTLDAAPDQMKGDGADQGTVQIAIPDPSGALQHFAVYDSPVMEPALAAKYPDVHTYKGVGIDDPTADIRADLTPLGFHASVRSSRGSWYIDPLYHLDQSVYASYMGAALKDAHGTFVERDGDSSNLNFDRGFYHPSDPVTLHGSSFAADAQVSITISDPVGNYADRTVTAQTDALGNFASTFVADPNGNLDMHMVTVSDGDLNISSSYDVVTEEDLSHDPPTGDIMRNYRVALVTDPGYATWFGDINGANPELVEPAKVTLMNRVNQIYEDDMSVHLSLVANDDLLNLDTWAKGLAPNGACGTSPCFAQSDLTGCNSLTKTKYVIGQILGNSDYDVGHLALGEPGGGVASLGVIGRAQKAQGCTGIPQPVGDYYAVDYVAHEMGHQFSGNHSYNGTQFNCSTSNRNGATSVEPGSGSSVMAYAGICLTDDLSRHSDPYFSQRSQQEITNYITGAPAAVNALWTASLRKFGGGNEVQAVTFGPLFQTALTIQPLSVAIGAANTGLSDVTNLGGIGEVGNTVTVSTGNVGAATTLAVGDQITISGVPVSGYNGGPYTVLTTPSSRGFTFNLGTTGLANSGGGSFTLVQPGLTESGTTATVRVTGSTANLAVGNTIVVSGAGVTAYNGTQTITAITGPKSFQYSVPLPAATTVTAASNATGTLAVFTSTNSLSVGQSVTVTGLSNAAYNGTWVVTARTGTSFTADIGTSGNPAITAQTGSAQGSNANLPNSGAGSATFTPGFQMQFNGQNSATIGGSSGTAYNQANIQAAFNAIPGILGTVTVGTVASTGFTVTFNGTGLAGIDQTTFSLQNLNCNGCFYSVEETVHGGTLDSFTISYNGNASATITNGTNYTNAGIKAAIEAITGWPAGATVTVANYGGGGNASTNGFQVAVAGTMANTPLAFPLQLTNMTGTMSGWFGITDRAGNDTRGGGSQTATGNDIPVVTAPAAMTIPYRTPFTLTGSATDADPLVFNWEQNDVGPTSSSGGTGLVFNNKVNGPLFAMFPKSSQIDDTCAYTYGCAQEQSMTANPSRTFPDLQQIIDNNTNADTGICPAAPLVPQVPQATVECFSEFLPTSAYVGLNQGAQQNASPPRLDFRLTARDLLGGVNNANVALTLAAGTGPFLVTSPNSAVSWDSGSTQAVTWNVAGTDANGINTANVKISLSTDGGHTYPTVLNASTPNDGTENVTIPNTNSTTARIKIEAVGNVFFDISNADFTIAKASSSIALQSSQNPSVHGESVSFTATVSSDGGTPSGTVQFQIDGSDFGSPVTLSGGQATSGSTSSLSTTTHNITATYSGDDGFSSASTASPLVQTVNQASSSTAVVSDSGGTSVYGQGVTFTATISAVAPGAGTPTGTVQFSVDTVDVGSPVNVDGVGQATSASISNLSVGAHTIGAVYSGDTDFSTSSGSVGQQVDKADTTTSITNGDDLGDDTVVGQSYTVEWSVQVNAPGAGTPTGTVTVTGGSGCSAPVADGQCDVTSTEHGSKNLVATYGGDGNFNGSASDNGPHDVNLADTSVSIQADINPSVHGQAVSFTATVSVDSPGAGAPTGTVQFQIDGTDFGTPVTLNGSEQATSDSISSLSTQGHSITASYSGDSEFNGSSSSSYTQTVNQASSSAAVASSVNPSVHGQSVSFTATVSAVSPGAGTPTGLVQFKIDGVDFGSAVSLDGAGQATSGSISSLSTASHSITAVYGGDPDFTGDTSDALSQVVNKANSVTTMTSSSANPSVHGQSVTFTAHVAANAPGSGTPTGNVQFKRDGVNIGSPVALNGSANATSPAITTLSTGSHVIKAYYLGSSDFNTSNSSAGLTQVVNKASTTSAIADSPDPSKFGHSFTLTATITVVAPGAGIPAGKVQFYIDGSKFHKAVSLSNGHASVLVNVAFTKGTHHVQVKYLGNANFLASNSPIVNHTIN